MATGLLVTAALAGAAPADAAFGYRKQFTVAAAQVVGGPLANFPALVSLTDPNLRLVANGGRVATGADFQFRGEDAATCGGPATCTLDFEVERYDGTTGTLVAWVRVPSLDNGRSIYLSYGDAAIACSQQNRGPVWDAVYREVYHLSELADYSDSTSNHYTAVTKGTVTQGVAGKIGLAAQFGGPAESRLIASDGTQPANTSYTLEAWVRFASLQAGLFTGIVNKGRESGSAGVGLGDWMGLYKDGGSNRLASGWECCAANKPSNLVDGTTVLAINTWYHLVGTYDGATGFRYLYINGALVASDTTNVAKYASIPQFLRIGDDSNGNFHNGQIDEVRVGKDLRPAGWVATTYRNENNPGAFFTATDVGASGAAGTTCPAANACAGGPGSCNLRSIGTRADYGTAGPVGAGTQVSVTNGSVVVTGTGGTQWAVNDRGRGDRITINAVAYTVASVDSNTQLRLTAPFAAASGTYNYLIARKFKGTTTSPLVDWEACIDGPGGPGCENVSSASLIADNRSEIGIVYADGASYTFPAAGQPILTINGATTDAAHTITLTVDPGNRHLGIPGAGVVLDNAANTTTPIRVQDSYVTLEWLELKGGTGAGVHGVDFVPNSSTNAFVLRNSLIHNISGQSVRLTSAAPFVAVADIYDNFIYGGGREGIEVNQSLLAGSRVRILNNTLYRNNTTGLTQQIGTAVDTTNPFVLLRNNIFVSDVNNPNTSMPWPNVGSGTNILGNGALDAAPPTSPCTPGPPPTGTCYQSDLGPSPRGAGQFGKTEASLAFVSTATPNLHIASASVARDTGASLSTLFTNDIDAAVRSAPWDVGADEFGGLAAVGSGCAVGSAPTGPNFVVHGNFDQGAAATAAANGFSTSATYTTFQCPGDTSVTVRTSVGLCGGTNVSLSQFPGDPAFGIAAAPNSLYTNGNNTGGAYISWRQTVSGLQANTTYVFYTYASNGNNSAVVQPPSLPLLRFCKGVSGAGPYSCTTQLNADFTIPNETAATGDYWTRYQVTFTTGPAETSVDLAVLDAAPNVNGDDLQMTQFGVQACGPPTTAVKLESFAAAGTNGGVSVSWETASELDNLGFNVYRGASAAGPWSKLNAAIIPGLGSSPIGQSYGWADSGLVNGTTYYYRLEDVDTHAVSTFHGPISAVPAAAAAGPVAEPSPSPLAPPGPSGAQTSSTGGCPAWVWTAYAAQAAAGSVAVGCTAQGQPEAVSLDEVSRTSDGVTLELRTGGFYAVRDRSGTVRVFVPGFASPEQAGALALPSRRVMVEAEVGRGVRLGGVQALDPMRIAGTTPAATAGLGMLVLRDGTVRPAHRALAAGKRAAARDLVTLAGTAFLGETKAASVEISPWSVVRGDLVLARLVRVRLLFSGREAGERGQGARGRRTPLRATSTDPNAGAPKVLAQLFTAARGLYAVGFEQLLPAPRTGIALGELALQRQGSPVPFHVEPQTGSFGPGSVLYFLAPDEPASTAFSGEIAWELVRATGGVAMSVASAAPSGPALAAPPTSSASFESNLYYQPGLLDAPDTWLWDAVTSGATRSESFSLVGVDASRPASLSVFLQGASESGNAIDHHIRLAVNGVDVGETGFAGMEPRRLDAVVPPGLLIEGPNTLGLTNLGDTGVPSIVFLDRFQVDYPHRSAADSGRLQASWSSAGTASIGGLASPAVLLDATTPASPVWLRGFASTGSSLRFGAAAGRVYLAVSAQSLLAPRVAAPVPSSLADTSNQADYVLIAPSAFMAAAQPLLDRRSGQGLTVRAASLEEIASRFGHGASSAAAIHDFLTFAYQSWKQPSPRYVVLLGGSAYDPRNFTGRARPAPLPYLLTKTSFLWTASDPLLAAVNGDDAVPDLAIGRLPASTTEEAETLVAKLLDWEDSRQGLGGDAVLVADNPDAGGAFEQDVDDIAQSFFASRPAKILRLSELGDATRPAILDAFDSGASLMSYVGHGGAAVWASENVLNSWDAPSLLAQPQQPLMLSFDCLNGYFLAPSYDSLAEAFLKVAGRGSIAAVASSGLSLDQPAHVFHRALVGELTSGRHARLGDAFLAAELDYARSGQMPELLSVYQLFGDPALVIR